MLVCPGCPGCETNLTDRDLEYELELETLMSERPDGNSGPPQTSFTQGWHVSPLRMVPTPRGKGVGIRASRVRAQTQPMDINSLAARMFAAMGRV